MVRPIGTRSISTRTWVSSLSTSCSRVPVIHFPRFRALALFRRRPPERVEGLPDPEMMGEQWELFGQFEIAFEDLAELFEPDKQGSLYRARLYDDRHHKE